MPDNEAELQARMDANARTVAHDLNQDHLGPDGKITDMVAFMFAIVNAIKAAREQGQIDATGELGRAEISKFPTSR